MLGLSLVFFICAIVSALFGFGGLPEPASSFAMLSFVVFLVLFVAALIFGAPTQEK